VRDDCLDARRCKAWESPGDTNGHRNGTFLRENFDSSYSWWFEPKPSEKYNASQIGANFPQVSGKRNQKIKPPPFRHPFSQPFSAPKNPGLFFTSKMTHPGCLATQIQCLIHQSWGKRS